jgi:hypothetical protein
VIAFHIGERFLIDGRFDTARTPARPVRLPGLRSVRESLRDGSPKGRRRHCIAPAEK